MNRTVYILGGTREQASAFARKLGLGRDRTLANLRGLRGAANATVFLVGDWRRRRDAPDLREAALRGVAVFEVTHLHPEDLVDVGPTYGPTQAPIRLSEVQERLAVLMGETMQRRKEDPRVYIHDVYGGRRGVATIRLDWQPDTLEEAERGVTHPVVEFLPPVEPQA